MQNNIQQDEVEQRAENAAEIADVQAPMTPEIAREAVKLDAAMGQPAVEDPVTEEWGEQLDLVVRQAEQITVVDDESNAAAGAFLTDVIKIALADLADTFDPIDDAQKAARKVTIAARKKHEQPLLDAQRIIKAAMGTYWTEQERIRKAAEAKRLDDARREAEDRAVEEAARLEANGQQEAAEERLAAPVAPVVTAPALEAPKVEGVSVRTNTTFRVTNEAKIGRDYLKVDTVKIGKMVRAMGVDAERLVGGIEVYSEPVVAARSSR